MSWKMPENTDWAKAQNLHEATRSYGQEIYEIAKQRPHIKALEIGSAWGVSAMAILMGSEANLTGVDPDPTNKAITEIPANGLQDRWTFHLQRSEEFWKQNKETYDLIFLDGSHLYEDFKNDVFEAWKVLEPNGVLICDDICHKANRGVDINGKFSEYGISLAAWEFIKEHHIEHIHTTTRLLYIYKDEQ